MNTNFKTFLVDMWINLDGEEVSLGERELVVGSHWTVETLQQELEDNPPEIEFNLFGNTLKYDLIVTVMGVKR